MSTSDWIKPVVLGAAVGAVAATVIGFGYGGWTTASKATAMAEDYAHTEVVSALIPFCVERSAADPEQAATLVLLKEASSYERADIVMKTSWAQMPGETTTSRNLAKACAEKLIENR